MGKILWNWDTGLTNYSQLSPKLSLPTYQAMHKTVLGNWQTGQAQIRPRWFKTNEVPVISKCFLKISNSYLKYANIFIEKKCVKLLTFFQQKISVYLVGWLVGCFGFNGPLRQYFSLYQAVSQREGERGERIDESKNFQTTPNRTYC